MASSFPQTPSGMSPVAVCLLTLSWALPGAFLAWWLISSGLDKRPNTEPIDGGLITVGTVVDFQDESTESIGTRNTFGDDRVYRAVVEFSANGKTYRFVSESGDHKPAVGDKVEVSYDPDDPANARDLDTNAESWRLPFWAGVFIAAVEVLGSVTLAFAMLRRRRSTQVATTT